MGLSIRPVTLADIPGLLRLHAGCDDPWALPADCALWVNHRLLRGFMIDVAMLGKKPVGHAEWIVSHEPEPLGRFLYLSMIQVHSDHQHQGISRAMLEAGIKKAQKASCPYIRTAPEKGGRGFYRKCGFKLTGKISKYSVTVGNKPKPGPWEPIRTVPRKVIKSLPMRLGWVQGASAHMWEVCNRPVPVYNDTGYHPCIRTPGGDAFVQLRYFDDNNPALALAWAAPRVKIKKLTEGALFLARQAGRKKIHCAVLDQDRRYFDSLSSARFLYHLGIWSKGI